MIDCGSNGRLQLQIHIQGDVLPLHREVFAQIVSRWAVVWEIVEDLVSGMSADYEGVPKIANSDAIVLLDIPNQHITDETSWSVSVQFPEHGSIWHVEFDGWDYSPEGTQPIF